MNKKVKGITLISLVITIVVLIILSSVAIYLSLGNNGILTRTKQAKEVTNKQEATEKINLKITTAQMNKYAEKQVMPTLKELSEVLKDDNEIQYVTEKSQVASKKYEVGENPNSIYTKLNKYPYEFEINSSLQLASIDGVQISQNIDNMVSIEIYNELKAKYEELLNNKNITFIDDNRSEINIPEGITKAYILYVESANINAGNCNFSSPIIKSSSEAKYVTRANDRGYIRTSLRIYELELTGDEGQINVTASNPGNDRWAWISIGIY